MLTITMALFVLTVDLAAVTLTIPVVVLLVEIVAALLPRREGASLRSNEHRARVAVLVPAHDERLGLQPTIENIAAQLEVGDRLLVVADNCTDDTAAIAAAAGAEVVERYDSVRVGKGYALDFGLRRLEKDPPDIVIVIDADCRPGAGAIAHLRSACLASGRPVQAVYLMTRPDHSAVDYLVAEFAWRVKNWARPLGLQRLGLPCQLMGTGMAFPWALIRASELATGEIVEDLRLGLDLALAGSPPVFCPAAVVTSHFPVSAVGAASQRKRWERGHINLIRRSVLRLFWLAAVRRRSGLAALALDMAVPPLALLALILSGTLFLAGAAALLVSSHLGLWLAALDFMGFVAAMVLSWVRWGRDLVPLAYVGSIALYVIAKLGLYGGFLTSSASEAWVRTDRTK